MRRLLSLLPSGTVPVAMGVAVYGFASYVYLAVAGHALDEPKMAALSVLWSVVFAITVGVFMPLEQELTRLVAGARALGDPVRPIMLKSIGLVTVAVASILLIALVAQRPIADTLYGGDRTLVWATAGSLAAYAVVHATRGLLAGMHKFAWYGAQCGIDGTVRIVGVVLLSSTASAGDFALLLCIAPLISVMLTAAPLLRPLTSFESGAAGATVRWNQMLRGVGLLMAAGLVAQIMANIVVVDAYLLSEDDGSAAVALLAAMVLVRIPIVVFGSMYSAMLTSATTAVANNDAAAFRMVVRRTLFVVSGLAIVVGGVCIAFGPQITVLLFDSPSVLNSFDFLLLSVGTGAYLWAMVLGQAVLALGHHGKQAIAWIGGLAVLLAVTLLPLEVTLRVELAYLAGMTVSAGWLVMSMYWASQHLGRVPIRIHGGIPAHDAAA